MPDADAGDAGSDENAQLVKVSKRKVEAKIREIAVYELRLQCYKYKLWYVNDKVLEKLELSLPVPTEWNWITLTSVVKSTDLNTANVAKQSVSVTNVQPSPLTTNGTIKSFMSPMTANGSNQQSPAGNSVNAMKGSCGMGQSPGLYLQQSSSETNSKVETDNLVSPVCTTVICDNGTDAGAKRGCENPVQPISTPCSSSAAKKRKIQSFTRHSLPVKQQPRLLFKKKPKQPTDEDDCIVVDSCIVKHDDSMPNADKTHAQQSDVGVVDEVKVLAQQLSDDDDCMIVDSNVLDSESRTKLSAAKEHSEPDAGVNGTVSDIPVIDEKSLPETDANSNVCVASSTSEPTKATAAADN